MLQPLPPAEAPDVKGPARRQLISSIAVILAAGVAFGVVGTVRSDDGQVPEVVAEPGVDTTDPADVAEPSDAVDDEPDTSEPVDVPVAEPTAEVPATEPEPVPEPSEDPPASSSDGDIDPSTITLQVLDAVLDDGGEAAQRVAEEMRGDGYRVVAVNGAIRQYEKTTVMYTAGFEAQARQIAAQYGYTEVQLKPDNLNDTVQVHLVVGLDA